MKKITDLKEGDLITLQHACKIFDNLSEKTLYHWRSKSELEPEKYPRSAKIGGTVFFLKSDIIDFLNRAFAKAS
jgi:predicted DNA-binding transcriptional regulator AlpA